MSYSDPRVRKLLLGFFGVPLDLAVSLFPTRCKLRYLVLAHIHLHSRSQVQHANSTSGATTRQMRKNLLSALTESLIIYGVESMGENETPFDFLLKKYAPKDGIARDLGVNTGRFSQTASLRTASVVWQTSMNLLSSATIWLPKTTGTRQVFYPWCSNSPIPLRQLDRVQRNAIRLANAVKPMWLWRSHWSITWP